MPGGQDTPLANTWRGVNRAVAPFMLQDQESPDCKDCAHSEDMYGLLGPRRGRQKVGNKNFAIEGAVSVYFPWGPGRIFMGDDGAWTFEETPFAAADEGPFVGWDRVVIDSLVATRGGGAGTTNGTAKTLSAPLELGDYAKLLILDTTYSPSDVAGNSTDYVAKLQGKIDGVWTDIYKITRVSDDIYPQQVYTGGTGELTEVRASVTTNDANTVTATWQMDLYLVNTSERDEVTIS